EGSARHERHSDHVRRRALPQSRAVGRLGSRHAAERGRGRAPPQTFAPPPRAAQPFRNRVPSEDSAVVTRLNEAGAVLIAKLSLGALALNDIWFGGQTMNPWLLEEGASGSSAGPGAATAAGLVAFSIGSETGGSIVSPSM